MPRKRFPARSTIEPELFPFLSILVCTIGVLILLIIVMTSQTMSSQRKITIVAKSENGQNGSKQPRYIECRGDGIVLYPSKEFVTRSEISSNSSLLQNLLQEIQANQDTQYLILAVRPDGIEVFKMVRVLVESQGINIGYEPIDEGWDLNIETAP